MDGAPMQELLLLVKHLKVRGLVEGLPEADVDEMLDGLTPRADMLKDPRRRLDGFRAAVGDEHYRALAAGHSFTSEVDAWERREGDKLLFELAEKTLDLIRKYKPDANVTLGEVLAFVRFMA